MCTIRLNHVDYLLSSERVSEWASVKGRMYLCECVCVLYSCLISFWIFIHWPIGSYFRIEWIFNGYEYTWWVIIDRSTSAGIFVHVSYSLSLALVPLFRFMHVCVSVWMWMGVSEWVSECTCVFLLNTYFNSFSYNIHLYECCFLSHRLHFISIMLFI